jgi:hypothetical protein
MTWREATERVFRESLRNLPDFEDDEWMFEVPDDPTSHMVIGSEEWNTWHEQASRRRHAGTRSGFSSTERGRGDAGSVG